MPRTTLTTAFLRGAFAQETGVCPIFLVTINHPGLDAPIYVSSDPTQRLDDSSPTDIVYGTVSRGTEFIFYPFTLTLPSDEDEGPGNMMLQIDNVRRQLTSTIRSIIGPPTITTEIVLSESPDDVEATWPDFLLVNVSTDASTIQGTLMLETLVREPFPGLSFTPGYFPALF